MKLNLIILCSAVFMSSCQSAIKDEHATSGEEISIPVGSNTEATLNKVPGNSNMIIGQTEDLEGYWVGMFEPDVPDTVEREIYTGELLAWDHTNKINLSIDVIADKEVSGHSVVAGNIRPFKGSFSLKGDQYSFVVKEPGDDKFDGAFKFRISKGDSVIKGEWKAYGQIENPKRKFVLSKRIFKYDPSQQVEEGLAYTDWDKIKTEKVSADEDYYEKSYFTTTEKLFEHNASERLLAKADVENLTKADIFILRNSIYARHGYTFRNRQLRAYFDGQSWYIPVTKDVKAALTPLEKKNIELLLRYEKNAVEYYDEFGRG